MGSDAASNMDNVFSLETLTDGLGTPERTDSGLSWRCGCVAAPVAGTTLFHLVPCEDDDGRLVGQ
jgi:hypothetical protein